MSWAVTTQSKKHELQHLRFVNRTDVGKWPEAYKRFATANIFKHNKVLNIHSFSSNTWKVCSMLDNPQTPHKNNTHSSSRDMAWYTISVICQLGIPGQLNQKNNKRTNSFSHQTIQLELLIDQMKNKENSRNMGEKEGWGIQTKALWKVILRSQNFQRVQSQSFGYRMRLKIPMVIRAQEILPVLDQKNRKERQRFHSEHNLPARELQSAVTEEVFFPINQYKCDCCTVRVLHKPRKPQRFNC